MVANLTPSERSVQMARIKREGMTPEMRVRRIVHGLGFRCRLHRKNLPGKQDLVSPGRRQIIFVHCCFWHLHPGCRLARVPHSRLEYWLPMLHGNRERDARNCQVLESEGGEVLVVWECAIKDEAALVELRRSPK